LLCAYFLQQSAVIGHLSPGLQIPNGHFSAQFLLATITEVIPPNTRAPMINIRFIILIFDD
jgi:hypothetical protein